MTQRRVSTAVALAVAVAAAALLALALPTAQGEKLEAMSFGPPFNRVDGDGRRILNDTWRYGGSTEARKHFVRLTTDRQSKRGHVWMRERLGRDTFSTIITFRISGVGKRWFGDGIGIWFTDYRNFKQGPNHGFADKFTGMGVVIDTFNNPDHRGGHKDVSIQINDGSKDIDAINSATRIGCDAAVRYHEQSASFDPVHSLSRLKIKIDGTRVVVEVDEANNGRWKACQEVTLPFTADWLRTATMGITGATGALADNHDLISVDAFADFNDQAVGSSDTQTILHTVSKEYKKWLESPNCGADCMVAVLQKEMANFRVQSEHRFLDLKEKTLNNVQKIRDREKDNERRVKEIEQQVARAIDSRVDATKETLHREVNAKISLELAENVDVGSGWKMPFFLLAIALSAGAAFVYRKYQALMKSHLL